MLHPYFIKLQKLVYQPAGLDYNNIYIEPESQEYAACRVTINNKYAHLRVAKITPTKVGQFVTLWKRSASGPIAPFDACDPIDFFIVAVDSEQNFGHFIFPKSVLLKQDVLSTNNMGGKRAIRVYPPWDKADNKQAIKTQTWQLPYFFMVDPVKGIDLEKIKAIFS